VEIEGGVEFNPNGKVDRKALPEPGDAAMGLGTEYVEPRTELERQLAGIWVKVIKLERVGIHDNYFDLGGHSLMATQVVSRVLKDMRIELPVSWLFVYPTVAELAQRIDSQQLPGQGSVADGNGQIKRVNTEIDTADLEALSDSQVAELLSELSEAAENQHGKS
jgi:acyl carrier protein